MVAKQVSKPNRTKKRVFGFILAGFCLFCSAHGNEKPIKLARVNRGLFALDFSNARRHKRLHECEPYEPHAMPGLGTPGFEKRRKMSALRPQTQAELAACDHHRFGDWPAHFRTNALFVLARAAFRRSLGQPVIRRQVARICQFLAIWCVFPVGFSLDGRCHQTFGQIRVRNARTTLFLVVARPPPVWSVARRRHTR